MARNSDTRALTREAYPHVLKTGANPSVSNIKEWVRTYRASPDWNPSVTTINDELTKIRAESGNAMLAHVQFPELDPMLAELTGEYFQKIHAIIRDSAAGELAETRHKVMEHLAEGKKAVQEAQDKVSAMHAELETAKQEFERREIKSNADLEHQATTIAELRQSLQELATKHAASEARNIELAKQVERITAERTADAERHDSQLKQAEARYKGLERAKLMELDNTRTERDRALNSLERIKAELTDVRNHLGAKSVEAAEIRGEARALREQVAELTERLNGSVATNNELQIENRALAQACDAAEAEVRTLGLRTSDLASEVARLQGLVNTLPSNGERYN